MTEEERLKDVGVGTEGGAPAGRSWAGAARAWWGGLRAGAAVCESGALWRVVAAEGAGAGALVLLGCARACLPPHPASPVTTALATGATVAMLVQWLDDISTGMLSPAVALTALLVGRLSARRCVLVVCAQLAGAVLGAALLGQLAAGQDSVAACLTKPHHLLHPFKAAVWECVCTLLLCLVNCAHWHARAPRHHSWPLTIGTVVTALVFAIGELTGASMNPARSAGPALVAAHPAHHWVYWAGPLSGALLAAALSRALGPRHHQLPSHPSQHIQ